MRRGRSSVPWSFTWIVPCAAAASVAIAACSTDDASLASGDAGASDDGDGDGDGSSSNALGDSSPSASDGGGSSDAGAGSGDTGSADASGADASASDAAHADGAPPSDASGVDAAPADAAPQDASAQDAAPLEAGVCNLLVNTAPSVPETNVASAAPAPQGGTVVVGRYYLTQWQVFTGQGGASGPTGNTRKYVIDLHANGTYDEVIADNGNPDEHYTRTWSTQGTFFNSTQLCPTMEPLGDDYTATATTLTLSAYGVVMTFTKQ